MSVITQLRGLPARFGRQIGVAIDCELERALQAVFGKILWTPPVLGEAVALQ